MFTCDYCKKECNYTTNVFITLELCPSCYEKWKSGELGKEKKEKEETRRNTKNEVENGKERG